MTTNQTPNQPHPNTSGVLHRNHTTAIALSVFLGIFGIDQFYLGKTGKGLLKLFTLGLFGILWVVDIIMIATKSVNNIVWEDEDMNKQKSGNWFAKHKVLTALIALFVFGAVVAGSGKDKTKNANTTTAANTSTTATQAAAKPATATPAATIPTRQAQGTAATLGAGSFTGGSDVAVGLYNVTPGAGQSGNFSTTGANTYNEILGTDSSLSEVPKVRVQVARGDKISISGLSAVMFTPVTSPYVTTQSATDLYAGTFTVGQDVAAGRYTVTPGAGQSGNFSTSGSQHYNEILGSDTSLSEVPSLKVSLSKGDKISISGLSQVTFTPSN